MLKDKEIATLKKQLDIMRNQFQTQTNITQQSDIMIPQTMNNNNFYFNNTSGGNYIVNSYNLNSNTSNNYL